MKDETATTGYIYAYTCPDTGVIRYVGKSKHVPFERFLSNVRASKILLERQPGDYKKSKSQTVWQWFHELMMRNKYPGMIILCECPHSMLAERETFYYLKYRHLDLLNQIIPSRGEMNQLDIPELSRLVDQKSIPLKVLAKLINLRSIPEIRRFLCGEKSLISVEKSFTLDRFIREYQG